MRGLGGLCAQEMGEALIADDKDSLTWAMSPPARLAEEPSAPKEEDALHDVPESRAGLPHVTDTEGVVEDRAREASPPIKVEEVSSALQESQEGHLQPLESRSPSTETEC